MSPQFSAVHAHWSWWKDTTGPVDYEGSRCSNEISINVRLTLHLREKGLSMSVLYLALHLSMSWC